MKDSRLYNGSNLAYLGDAYYELRIRHHLLTQGITKNKELRQKSLKYVTATAHLYIYEKIKTALTVEEQAIFLRGRNNAPSCHRKNVDRGAYVISSGLEAVIGYLYLKGDFFRLDQLFMLIFNAVEGEQP